MNHKKGKLGLMAASLPIMSYTACTSILASIAQAYPEAPLALVQMLTSIAGIVIVICSIGVGWFTPYFTKRSLILVTGLLYPLSGLIIYFYHPNVSVIAVFTALMGVASGVRATCVAALICDCYNKEESARLLGAQGGFISVGAMFFVWLASQLAKVHWERCYLVYTLIFFILIVEFFCLPKGKLDPKKEKSQNHIAIPAKIWYFTLIDFAGAFMVAVFISNISMLVELRHLGSTVQAGYSTTVYNFVGIFAGIITGRIITHIREWILPAGVVFGFLGMLSCYFGNHLIILCAGGALCGCYFSIVTPAANYFASVYASDYNRSLCIALVNAGTSMGLFLSPLIYGTLLKTLPTEIRIPSAFLIAGIGFLVIGVITILVCLKEKRHR